MHKLNIVVAGKSGVGKSSLLNYIIGNNTLFETGDGAPVTQHYFNKEIFKSNNIEYHLFDTKGVEPDTVNEFYAELTDQIDRFSENSDVFERMHTLYYCFGANNKRIEPFEISFIKDMMDHLDVVIVFTKSDLISEEVKVELKREISKTIGGDIKILNICSISKKLRIGEVKPFGKEEVLRHAFMGLWNTFSKHVPRLYESLFFDKQVALDFNDKAIRRGWYKYFGSNLSGKNKRHLIYLDQYMFYRYGDFIAFYFGDSFTSDFIKLTYDFLRKSNELLYNEVEATYVFNNIIDNCNLTYRKIHDFYSTLTNVVIPYQPLLITEKKLKKLCKILSLDVSGKIKELNKEYLRKFWKLKREPTWFGGDERQLGQDFIKNYISEIVNIHNDVLLYHIDDIESTYETELSQFGDILIKNSFNEQNQEPLFYIDHVKQLTANQKIYYKKLKEIYEEKIFIDQTLRNKLDFLREALEIIPQDAGLIEDFINRS
ncbi:MULTISPECIES: GTPase domain-containing protein [Sphingobacterium]|jgi:GTP-binding protein EngB required for normal cell division|uniref:GTPase domain-containing protein n=1 Tax=Sphingobacterium TaxID=28453 RepID=UPI00257DA85F|nr:MULTISPECIES: GTPase domain-containing protein [Sphingobacterium]MDF2849858.1 hypothetical protein [Sphingobacterium multivorum]